MSVRLRALCFHRSQSSFDGFCRGRGYESARIGGGELLDGLDDPLLTTTLSPFGDETTIRMDTFAALGSLFGTLTWRVRMRLEPVAIKSLLIGGTCCRHIDELHGHGRRRRPPANSKTTRSLLPGSWCRGSAEQVLTSQNSTSYRWTPERPSFPGSSPVLGQPLSENRWFGLSVHRA